MAKTPCKLSVSGGNFPGAFVGVGEVNIDQIVHQVAPAGGESTTHVSLPDVFADYVRRKTKGFVGRAHLFAEIERFLADHPCGYLTLIGEPGIGKSALVCELTRRRKCESHFFIRTDGITSASQLYDGLEASLIRRFDLDLEPDPGSSPGVRLRRVFSKAAVNLKGEKLVIVVDALDECDDIVGGAQGGNTLLLPRALPDGVYVILTRRPLDPAKFNVRLETDTDVGNVVRDLMSFTAENNEDIAAYLRAYYDERPKDPWLVAHRLTVEEAVASLVKRSDGNFMYLRHVLPLLTREPKDFEPASLPQGLEEYYRGHWRRMLSGRDSASAEQLFATVYLLAVAREPLTAELIAQMLPTPTIAQAQSLLSGWREFLEQDERQERGFSLYHASFADFLLRQDAVEQAGRWRAANRSLKRWLMARLWGGAPS